MADFHDYPYTNFHDQNLDWLLRKYNELKMADIEVVNDLKNRVSATESDVDALDARVVNLEHSRAFDNKKYLFVTDSFGAYGNTDGKNFIKKCCDDLGLVDGVDYQIIYALGYGFVGIDGTWLNLLMSYSPTIAKDKITDILFIGGNNDLTGYAGVGSAMTAIKSYVASNFDNPRIHVGFDCWNGKNTTTGVLNAYNTYRINSAKLGFHFMLGMQSAMHVYDALQADAIHPTSYGVNRLAESLESYLVNGTAFCDATPNGATFESDDFSTLNGSLMCGISDGTAFMYTAYPMSFSNGSIAFDGSPNTSITLCKLKGLGTMAGTTNSIPLAVYPAIQQQCEITKDGTTMAANCALKIVGNEMLLNLYGVSAGTITYINIAIYPTTLPLINC